MKLLFTGGTGFLGKNVRPILEKQYEVTTCGITPEDLDKACFFIAGIDEHSLLQAVNTLSEEHTIF